MPYANYLSVPKSSRLDKLAGSNIAAMLTDTNLGAIGDEPRPDKKKRKRVMVFVVDKEYNHIELAKQVYADFVADRSDEGSSSSTDITPDIQHEAWFKLRCLVSPTVFREDPILQQNQGAFALHWSHLHSLDSFDQNFKLKPHSKKCFGYKIMKGMNDLRNH